MIVEDFRAEYARYRALGEKAIAQVPDEALNALPADDANSPAMIVRHVSGNLVSRFTDFLTTDGEKPTRDREREFDERRYSRPEIDALWRDGFAVLDAALAALDDDDLRRTVTIRGVPLTVHAALARSSAHLAYHVGQLVLLGRMHTGSAWQWLSIPKGGTATYNAAPSPAVERGPRNPLLPSTSPTEA